ncbi:MAG: hypothetical protein ABMB14_12215, partial [Myxococcota bacterium]
ISGNDADEGGGVWVTGGTTAIEPDGDTPTEIVDNEADDYGGGIAADGGGLRVQDADIGTNEAGRGGGGIAVLDKGECDGCTYDVLGASVHDNDADEGGGLWIGRDLYLAFGEVADNHADDLGGAVYVEDAELLASDVQLRGNRAANGGAIAASGATVSADGVVFDTNSAAEAGAAVYVESSSELTLTDSSLQHNRVDGSGAIAIVGTGAFTSTGTTSYVDNDAHDVDVNNFLCEVVDDPDPFTCTGGVGTPCSPADQCL